MGVNMNSKFYASLKEISILRKIKNAVVDLKTRQEMASFGSEKYWVDRYAAGRNSGSGSYNHLAEFKAEILNKFVDAHHIRSVIEYGCGDGNQLKLANYPKYVGFDVSPGAIALCQQIFARDKSKEFKLAKDYQGERAELTISLDVLYHLIEDSVFENYLTRLFDSATTYVIIYSSDKDEQRSLSHIKHRKFTQWVDRNRQQWQLLEHIPNRYPDNGNHEETSFADFYIFGVCSN
jgi:SAM-dependent methyltransferase